MIERVSVGSMEATIECRGFQEALYLRFHGDFAGATDAQARQFARKTARMISSAGSRATFLDARYMKSVRQDLRHADILAEECAKVLQHHHRFGWLFQGGPTLAQHCRQAAERMRRTNRLRAGAFCRWDEAMAYLEEPGLQDPARFHRLEFHGPRRGTDTRPSSRIIGAQTVASTRATPSRPQV